MRERIDATSPRGKSYRAGPVSEKLPTILNICCVFTISTQTDAGQVGLSWWTAACLRDPGNGTIPGRANGTFGHASVLYQSVCEFFGSILCFRQCRNPPGKVARWTVGSLPIVLRSLGFHRLLGVLPGHEPVLVQTLSASPLNAFKKALSVGFLGLLKCKFAPFK